MVQAVQLLEPWELHFPEVHMVHAVKSERYVADEYLPAMQAVQVWVAPSQMFPAVHAIVG